MWSWVEMFENEIPRLLGESSVSFFWSEPKLHLLWFLPYLFFWASRSLCVDIESVLHHFNDLTFTYLSTCLPHASPRPSFMWQDFHVCSPSPKNLECVRLWEVLGSWRSLTKDHRPCIQLARAFIIPACGGRPPYTEARWRQPWEAFTGSFKAQSRGGLMAISSSQIWLTYRWQSY